MRTSVSGWLLVILVLLAAGCAAPAPVKTDTSAAVASPPRGTGSVVASPVAVKPPEGPVGTASVDWPTDRFMLTLQHRMSPVRSGPIDLYRTRDGGVSWQQIPNPSEARWGISLAIGPPSSSGRTVLLTADPSAGQPKDPHHVYRSDDEGDTWREVFSMPRQLGVPGMVLKLSPDFATDRTALITVNGRLFRSVDAGRHWTESTPWSDQVFGDVTFAPVGGADRPIFGTAVSSVVPSTMMDRRPRPTDDHIRSVGVVVSRDGGETWQPIAAQPELDGVPYRQMQSIVVSPTFEQDHTLVAFASGPTDPPVNSASEGLVWPAALFLSSDAGGSWQPIWRPESDVTRPSASPQALTGRAALSDTFAQDQGLLLMLRTSPSPSSASCRVMFLGKGGRGWSRLHFFSGNGAGDQCMNFPGAPIDVPGSRQVLLPEAFFPAGASVGERFVGSDGRVRVLQPRP